jgi:methyl-accepting chemotaxis protein
MPQIPGYQAVFGHNTLYRKILLMVALVTALTCGLITWNARQMLFAEAEASIALLAADGTMGAAGQIAGAVKFRKIENIESTLSALMARSQGRLRGGYVLDSEQQPLASLGDGLPPSPEMQALADAALQSGAMQTDASGMVVAAPALAGEKGPAAGVLVLAWSAEALQAQIAGAQSRAILAAVLAFAVFLGMSALYLRRALHRPLHDIELAMARVAQGNLAVATPLAERGDEIGTLAKALEIMRENLAQARAAEQAQNEDAKVQRQVVEQLSQGLQRLARGDLNSELPDTFPPAYAALRGDFNQAVTQLGGAISAVVAASQRIGTVAQSINDQSDNLAKRTENQAATLEQTAAALDELTAHVKSTAKTTGGINALVQNAETEAARPA